MKYSNEYNGDWVFPEFDDSNWKNAQILFSAVNQFAALGENPDAIWKRFSNQPLVTDTLHTTLDTTLSVIDTMSSVDSLSQSETALNETNFSETSETASLDSLLFFRKNLILDGKIVSGTIYVTADEDFRLYINGEYIIDDIDNDFFRLDTLDFYTFDRFIKEGRNVIAVDVLDKDYTGGGLKLFGNFELLPSDVISSADSEQSDQQVFINPEAFKKLNILRKNRIPLRQ